MTVKGQFSFQSERKAMPKMFKLKHNFAHLRCYQIMLKILQATIQQYVNHELPDVQATFRKGGGTRDQIANIHWIIEKARVSENIYRFIYYTKGFDYVDCKKLWKILKEMGIPDYLIHLLRNLHEGQEKAVR